MATPLQLTNADITGLLKNVYLKYRRDLFPIQTPYLANATRLKPGMENASWGGNGVFFDAVLTRPTGFTYSSAGYLPPSAQAIERQASIGIARAYVRRALDGMAIQATAGKQAAYESLVRKVIKEAQAAAKLGQQETIHGNGRGIKGVVGTVTDTTHIIVNNPYGVTGQGALTLDAGMYVAVVTSGGTIRGRATITVATLSGDNVNLTFDAAVAGMTAGDYVVAATTNDTALDAHANGLLNIFNYGGGYASLHGISQASYPRWDTTRLVAGTDGGDPAQPSEMDVWQLATLVANRSGFSALESPEDFLLTMTPGMYRGLAESFLGQRRWDMGATKELKGGFKALSVAGIACIQDYWQVPGTMYLSHLPSLIWIDLMDFVPLSYEGVGPWRFITDRDGYEWSFGAYYNMGTTQRNAHGLWSGYTDAKRYSHAM